jgi:translation initiation factor IF-1
MGENIIQNQSSEKPQKAVNSKDFIELEGEVVELMPDATFKVLLENGHEIFAYLAGRMRMNKIRLLPGDRVRLQISPYDLTKGRVVYRL